MSIFRRADQIRLIAVRLGQGELKNITREPGVHEGLRISIFYHDGCAPNSVATLRRSRGETCALQVVYDKPPEPVYFDLKVPLERYQNLLGMLRKTNFDKMDDQPDLPFYGINLWLVERIAGSFYHDIVLAPETAGGNHREIVRAFRQFLPESVREGVN